MFTGIIEAVGRVAGLRAHAGGARLVVEASFARDLCVGESVAVDGCCLTALPPHGGEAAPAAEPFGSGLFASDLSPETLARTTLGRFAAGRRVNLERAMRADGRLSGHVVQGHVDGTITLLASVAEGDGLRQRWSLAPESEPMVASKGSVSVDGVSLTVAALGPGWFEVALIPHTLSSTVLRDRSVGENANLELDITAKLAARGPGAARTDASFGGAWLERHSTGAPWESLVGYCRAVRTGSVVRVSGSAPVAEDGSTHAPGDAEAQATRCCDILREAVLALGGPDAVIVRTRLFVTDIGRWEAFGRAHARAFGAAPPVTTMVEVARLIRDDMLIEMEADAEIPPGARPPGRKRADPG